MFIQSRIKIQESPLKNLFWESSGQKMFLSPQPNLYIELLGNNVIPSISFSPACASDFVQNFNNICSGLFIKIYLVVSRIGICIGEASAWTAAGEPSSNFSRTCLGPSWTTLGLCTGIILGEGCWKNWAGLCWYEECCDCCWNAGLCWTAGLWTPGGTPGGVWGLKLGTLGLSWLSIIGDCWLCQLGLAWRKFDCWGL